ncbi:hypothetical protein SCLCIDRAFT_763892 [Scleroderma citrinum Foug A]|uniref:Uncharacterized protein n=1 Tax=Scleroderma citrinum Foug A TaxID=1036808 RepID=A0A0C3DRI1_9AGAM|nr:hypothetical protein SCLCIDRAFT_763892 [Scleroderma citrinum Foug A]
MGIQGTTTMKYLLVARTIIIARLITINQCVVSSTHSNSSFRHSHKLNKTVNYERMFDRTEKGHKGGQRVWKSEDRNVQ